MLLLRVARLTHALKTAWQAVNPVLLYSAALASGWIARTRAWHWAADVMVAVVLRSCVMAMLPWTAAVEMPNACATQ